MATRAMPAVVDDPSRAPLYRTAVDTHHSYHDLFTLPHSIAPRRVTLRDRVTATTIIPFASLASVPLSLLSYLTTQMNSEIERGDVFPMTDTMSIDFFGSYWFSNFGAIMLLGDWGSTVEEAVTRLGENANVEKDWEKECLGSFFIKPNYPGRSSHVCNGSFLTTDGARNRGVGRLMGESYIEWAPKLGYTYSVFNLVYENNVASCRIWDALGFKRIGRIKGCGHLKSFDEPVDAIMYGRELNPHNPEDFISEERFDKIKFYLKHQKYPDGADRAEKSRLRSAATHYRLVSDDNEDTMGNGEEKLFLKDKEVVGDAQKQYEIARGIHRRQHEGINKTTARVAERYHWVRIKETATLVVKNCPECSDPAKSGANPLDPTADLLPPLSLSQSSEPLPELQDTLPEAPQFGSGPIMPPLATSPPMLSNLSDRSSLDPTSAMPGLPAVTNASPLAHTRSIMSTVTMPSPISSQLSDVSASLQAIVSPPPPLHPINTTPHGMPMTSTPQQADPVLLPMQTSPHHPGLLAMDGSIGVPHLMSYNMSPVGPSMTAPFAGYGAVPLMAPNGGDFMNVGSGMPPSMVSMQAHTAMGIPPGGPPESALDHLVSGVDVNMLSNLAMDGPYKTEIYKSEV